jgi:hypothetical protein
MRVYYIGLSTLLVVFLLAGSGCGNRLVPVEGVVTLDGKPVEGATVMFVPTEGSGRPATGATESDGSFRLKSFDSGDGILPGNYKVTVSKIEGGPIPKAPEVHEEDADRMTQRMEEFFKTRRLSKRTLLPGIYSNAATTPLSCKVPYAGKLMLDLQSKTK